MNAIILSIGDELVLGQTVDTNSAWLSTRLSAVGCDIRAHQTVGDDQSMIESAIHELTRKSDLLLISGGLGPTEDDLTRQSLAAVMHVPLEKSDAWVERLKDFFEKRGRAMPLANLVQAMIPRGATMLDNPAGTAAGIRAKIGSCEIFAVPGVPKEMIAMFDRHIQPFVQSNTGGAVILQRKLNTFGLGESSVAGKLGDLMDRRRNPSVGTTVSGGLVSLRVNARHESLERAEREIDRSLAACREKLGDLVFSEGDQPLQEIIAAMLMRDKLEVTTAESCTGGLLAKMLTDVPGSSAYFKSGFITYSNVAKYERLGINLELINLHGAVSEPVADLMARNALRLAKANIALAISGIAGPNGGSPAKPVGTVCIAMAHQTAEKTVKSVTRTFNFPGDREMIRDRSAKMALSMLRYHLLNKKMPF